MASLFSERLAPAWSKQTSVMTVGSIDDSPLPLPGLRYSGVEKARSKITTTKACAAVTFPACFRVLQRRAERQDEWKMQIGSYINLLPSDSWRFHKLTRRPRRMTSTDIYCFCCLRRRDGIYCGTMFQRFGQSFGEPQPCPSYFGRRRLQELSILSPPHH